jgi:hypothetical protein
MILPSDTSLFSGNKYPPKHKRSPNHGRKTQNEFVNVVGGPTKKSGSEADENAERGHSANYDQNERYRGDPVTIISQVQQPLANRRL